MGPCRVVGLFPRAWRLGARVGGYVLLLCSGHFRLQTSRPQRLSAPGVGGAWSKGGAQAAVLWSAQEMRPAGTDSGIPGSRNVV